MTLMFILVFVVLGGWSYKNLIVESTPRIDFPLVSVKAIYPGATPYDIESQVIEKMEEAVSEVSDIKKIQTQIFQNFGLVLIEFHIGVDANDKTMEVKDAIGKISQDLPDDLEDPIIAKFNPLLVPIVELTITSDQIKGTKLYDFVDDNIKNEFTSITGVATADINGGLKRQINVKLDADKLAKNFLSLNDVVSAMATYNLNVPGGDITKGKNEFSVRFEGEYDKVSDIEKMLVVSPNGNSIPLAKLGAIEDSHEDIEKIARFNESTTIGISIMKITEGNAVYIAKETKKIVDKLNLMFKGKVKINVAYDSTVFIIDDTRLSGINILFGIILTAIILFVFLRDWRITVIAATVVPTSLISSFLLMDISEFSINTVTLLALGTVLGTLIANAIVIIESIIAEIEKGLNPKEASISGTKKATLAVFASAGTNLVVFAPISFMGGIIGEFMKHFGMTVIFATVFSIIASFTLTPMLCGLLLKPKKAGDKKKKRGSKFFKFKNPFANFTKHYINTILYYKKTVVIISIALIISPVAIIGDLGSEFMPTSDENTLRVKMNMPQGTAIEETTRQVAELEKIVCHFKEVENCLSSIGGNSPEEASIIVLLVDKAEREKTDLDLIKNMYTATEHIKFDELQIIRKSNVEDASNAGKDINLELYGRNLDDLVAASNKIRNIMDKSGLFASIGSSYKNPEDEYIFIPDMPKMIYHGVSNAQVGRLLRTAVNGHDDLIFREGANEYTINISLNDDFKKSEKDLMNLNVKTRGGILPIKRLGHMVTQKTIPPINRRDMKRMISVYGSLNKVTAGEAQKILDEEFKKAQLAEGITYRFGGMSEYFEEASESMVSTFILSVLLTFMLLAAILDSLVHPVTIALSIATSFVGVFFSLYAFGFSVNMGSMLTFIMLVGLSVNNAILLVERATELRREGAGPVESMAKAFEEKFRAVIMTSIAIVVGAIPQVFDPSLLKASMGIVIVGGMLSSILFSITLIPIVYVYIEKFKERMSRSKNIETSEEESGAVYLQEDIGKA